MTTKKAGMTLAAERSCVSRQSLSALFLGSGLLLWCCLLSGRLLGLGRSTGCLLLGRWLLGRGGLLYCRLLGLASNRLLGYSRFLRDDWLFGCCRLRARAELHLSAGSLGQDERLLFRALGNCLGDVVVEGCFRDLARGGVLLVQELLDCRAAKATTSLLGVGKDGFLDHGLWRQEKE